MKICKIVINTTMEHDNTDDCANFRPNFVYLFWFMKMHISFYAVETNDNFTASSWLPQQMDILIIIIWIKIPEYQKVWHHNLLLYKDCFLEDCITNGYKTLFHRWDLDDNLCKVKIILRQQSLSVLSPREKIYSSN